MPDLASLPRRAWTLTRRVLVFEWNIYRGLFRWLARRPSVPAGSQPLGYAQLATPMIALWIFASALEIPLIHVLVPWEGVRLALVLVGVWGLVWMLGMLGGLRSYPHLLSDTELRVRNGAGVDIVLPLPEIAAAGVDDRDLSSSVYTLQPRETPAGTDLQVGVSGRVNVTVTLREPRRVPTRIGMLDVVSVSFWTDDPRTVVRRLRTVVTG